MKLLIDVNQLLWNGPILVMLFGTHVYFTLRLRLVQRKIDMASPFSFRWQQKQKGIWAFWFAYNNARCYAWNRKYYRHFHRRFLRRTGCCILVLAHRTFRHGNHLRRNVFVPPFPLSGTRWTHVYSSFFIAQKNACTSLQCRPHAICIFYRMHHTKQRNNRNLSSGLFASACHLCDYNRFFCGINFNAGTQMD